MTAAPAEFFEPLNSLPMVRHAFLRRTPGIDVQADRATALARLEASHRLAARNLGFEKQRLIKASQVHGGAVAVATVASDSPVKDVDALVTADPSVVLGIYVADCAAIYLVDAHRNAIGLIHSGRQGTGLRIVSRAIVTMNDAFGTQPKDLVAVIAPCIRPPHYEVDFAADIVRQCHAAGVREVHDCGVCTASEPDLYYSYRREKGRTGRMLALLALR